MNYLYPYCKDINLFVSGRIAEEDARRQDSTAREILKRLSKQPGLILADEVGMGKTFVALAVAVSVALANKKRRPVVVMVPPSLKEKWPADFSVFKQKCLPSEMAATLRGGFADRAEDFLKMLDDPPDRKNALIFVTHGALSRGLNDKWVMLALIYQALKGRWGSDNLRRPLSRFAGELIHMQRVNRVGDELWLELLKSHPSHWLGLFRRWGIDPENDGDSGTADDPVPKAVWEILPRLNTDSLYERLQQLPRRRSKNFGENLKAARDLIRPELKKAWDICLSRLRLHLPLLILDEAHHLKNAQTRLAQLFQDADASQDADELSRGRLAGVFERMLFLTATPFQLGHSELCSVLDRFKGIDWKGRLAPSCGLEGFGRSLQELRAGLDAAQEAAITLDNAWGHLRASDLTVGQSTFSDVESWWDSTGESADLTPSGNQAVGCYDAAAAKMRQAEGLLKPWVIRHLKPKHLAREPGQADQKNRRLVLPGAAISTDKESDGVSGLPIMGSAVLPFLLSARAAAQAPDDRPVFAEGLASSYEAFLHTRQMKKDADVPQIIDGDDTVEIVPKVAPGTKWYLDQLEHFIPFADAKASLSHPKVQATVARAVNLWRSGEKVLIFCHYIATSKVLRQRLSETVEEEILSLGAAKLGCRKGEVGDQLEKISRRFFDEDSPARRACDAQAAQLLDEFRSLRRFRPEITEVIRRNVRTPSFLVRFFSLAGGRLSESDLAVAMEKKDSSGMSLKELLRNFLIFLVQRCEGPERDRYVEAVSKIQTGTHRGSDVAAAYAPDELQGASTGQLLPNVRLVNGSTKPETRQRLMLTFNTPFYPEILVASSVMAEGVDLHLNCRHVIHHDLCWNPSTLEQRTGRIDRIGAKIECCRMPLHVYLPYVSATQDEKQFRVVMDRERWFRVVMGEKYKVDLRTTEKLAERLPFPESAASALALHLEVV
jgi:ERCC4-related helicase